MAKTLKEQIIEEFGLEDAGMLEQMKCVMRVAMAKQMIRDLETEGRIPDDSREILYLACERLLQNKEMTGLQTSHRQMHYFDPKTAN